MNGRDERINGLETGRPIPATLSRRRSEAGFAGAHPNPPGRTSGRRPQRLGRVGAPRPARGQPPRERAPAGHDDGGHEQRRQVERRNSYEHARCHRQRHHGGQQAGAPHQEHRHLPLHQPGDCGRAGASRQPYAERPLPLLDRRRRNAETPSVVSPSATTAKRPETIAHKRACRRAMASRSVNGRT